MGIQNWSKGVLLVELPAEPETGEELKNVIEIIRKDENSDVVADFSNVDIVTSSTLTKLLKLRKMLSGSGHQLIFCGVTPATRGIFTVTGLDGVFYTVDDKFTALASLQMVS